MDGARSEEQRALTEAGQAFSRILVGIDGSERADEAARQAGYLAASSGAAVDLVYVLDPDHVHGADVEAEAEAALDRAGARTSEAGVQARPRVVAGDPGETLVADAEEHGADLVCVGPDAGLLSAAFRVGRVAAHVMRHARCSVMIARTAGPGAFPTRIACGVDGSDASVATASLAASIAAGAGIELHLLHVVPVFRGRDAEWTLQEDEPSPPELEGSVRAVSALGVSPVRDLAMGRPEHALAKAAERDGIDLLVVGHRGVRGVTKMLLGSVSEYVAEHAPCSVLVARPVA